MFAKFTLFKSLADFSYKKTGIFSSSPTRLAKFSERLIHSFMLISEIGIIGQTSVAPILECEP